MKKLAMTLVCFTPLLSVGQEAGSIPSKAVRAEQQHHEAELMLAAITTKDVDVKQLESALAKVQRDMRGREAIERARVASGA